MNKILTYILIPLTAITIYACSQNNQKDIASENIKPKIRLTYRELLNKDQRYQDSIDVAIWTRYANTGISLHQKGLANPDATDLFFTGISVTSGGRVLPSTIKSMNILYTSKRRIEQEIQDGINLKLQLISNNQTDLIPSVDSVLENLYLEQGKTN